MTLLAVLGRYCKRYLLTPEALLLCLSVFLLYSSVFYIKEIIEFMQRAQVKLKLKWPSRIDPHVDITFREDSEERGKVSWDLKKGNAAMYAIQGRRPRMEDRYNIVDNLDHTGTCIYGVFDGHGGEFAAEFVEKTLFKSIMVRLLKATLDGKNGDTFSQMLTEEVLRVDSHLLNLAKNTMEISGTTALVAMLKDNVLTVANVGDSRGVLCDRQGQAVPLSYDHKPQQLKERKRIRKAGGFISYNGVWRVAGVLATSRALGDFPLKEKNLIIAEPDILTFDLNEVQARFMILATDGLWDCFSNEEAVNFINERIHEPHFGAKSLVLQAYYRGSLDNITIMVVKFPQNLSAGGGGDDNAKEFDPISEIDDEEDIQLLER